jgi:hypothetical protein
MAMILRKTSKRTAGMAALFSATVFQLGFVSSCDDRLVGLTNYLDPCGTILGNCTPGFFQSINADLGDWCIDPACTVPGGCGAADPPLGTIRDICP